LTLLRLVYETRGEIDGCTDLTLCISLPAGSEGDGKTYCKTVSCLSKLYSYQPHILGKWQAPKTVDIISRKIKIAL